MRPPRTIPVESHLVVLCGIAGIALLFVIPWIPLGVAAGALVYRARARQAPVRMSSQPLTDANPDATCVVRVPRREGGPPVEPRRVLVLARGRPADDVALLLLARRMADRATITIAQVLPLNASRDALWRAHLHRQALAPDAHGVIVRSSDPLRTLIDLTRGFDLLLLTRHARTGVLARLRQRPEDQLAERAASDVIQLRRAW